MADSKLQQGQGPGIAMLTKNAQPMHALLLAACPCIAPQQGQAQIALGRHITGRWVTAIEVVERITTQLLCQLLSQHLGVEVQLLGTATEGTYSPPLGADPAQTGLQAEALL